MNKIVILTYDTGEVFVRDIPEDMEADEWWESDFNDAKLVDIDCHYMIVNQVKIDIK